MFGFFASKSWISEFSFLPLGPSVGCVCQKVIVTGLLIVTLSIALPLPAAAPSALSAATTPGATVTLPPVAAVPPTAGLLALPAIAAVVALATLEAGVVPTAAGAAFVAVVATEPVLFALLLE